MLLRIFFCRCARCSWPSWCRKRKEAASGEECERLLSNVIDEEACPLSKDQIETYLEKKTRTSRSKRDWRRREGWNQRQKLESVLEDEVEVSQTPGWDDIETGKAQFPRTVGNRLDMDDQDTPALISFVEKPSVRAEFDMAAQPCAGLPTVEEDFFDELESEEVIIGAKRFGGDELGNAAFIEQDAFDPDEKIGIAPSVLPVDNLLSS